MTAESFLDEKPSAEDFLNQKPSAEAFLSEPTPPKLNFEQTDIPRLPGQLSPESNANEIVDLSVNNVSPDQQARVNEAERINQNFAAMRSFVENDPEKMGALREAHIQALRDVGVTEINPDNHDTHFPKVEGADLAAAYGINPTVAKAIAGAQQGITGLAEGLLSPEALPMFAGGKLAKVIGASFIGNMAATYPEQVAHFAKALGEGDVQKAVASGVGVALTPFMVKAGLEHGAEAKPEAVQIADKIAPVAPLTAEALKSVAEAPKEIAAVESAPKEEAVEPVAPEVVAPETESPKTELAASAVGEPSPEIPLGISRAELENPSLKVLTDDEFDKEYRDAKKQVWDAETIYDTVGDPSELSAGQRQDIAEKQDRWSAARLERARRNNTDVHAEDIFHEMIDLADRGYDYPKFKALANILVERGADKGDVEGVYRLLPERLTRSNDFKEALEGKLEKLKGWLEKVSEENQTDPKSNKPVALLSESNPETTPLEEKAPTEPMIPMGASTPEELTGGSHVATSTRNAVVDTERARRGLPAAMKVARREFGEVWDRAMAKIDHNPGIQDELMKELRNKPRATTDEENALLLHRQIDLQNEYGRSTRDLAQAFDDGRMDEVAEEKIRLANFSDQLLDLYNIGKKVGTETGRGLAARKMMANDDFTLAQMELSKRAANGGRQLTDSERTEIQSLHEKISEAQKEYDAYKSDMEAKLVDRDTKLALAAAEMEARKTIDPVIQRIVDRIGSKLQTEADAAEARIKARLGKLTFGSGPVHELGNIKDFVIIGSNVIFKGAMEFGKWSAVMVEKFGDGIKPHLETIFKASNDHFNKSTDAAAGKKARETKAKILSAAEVVEKSEVALKSKLEKGAKSEIAFAVRKLARNLVENGLHDREKIVDKIHSYISTFKADVTRRNVMEMISGYGDYSPLTKDKISIEMRGYKGELQQILKLEDMAEGRPPLKSGMERRTPTEAERQLIKLVNDAKFKFQVPIENPETQLKSALDTLKTTLKNRITDLQGRLDRKEFEKKPRRELVLDKTAMRLKAKYEQLKKDFRQALNRDRYNKRTKYERIMDALVKWRRGFVLSGPVTLAKLTTAAIARSIITPAEEAVGQGLHMAFPAVSEKAMRHGGGLQLEAEAKAISEGLTSGMADAWKTLTTGKSDLESIHGKDPGLPQSYIDIFGNIHGALKAPLKRAEFARSFEKRMQNNARLGVDITDEFVQMRIAMESYQDALRTIFLQKNLANDMYKRMLATADQVDKTTQQPRSKLAGSLLRVALPIVKVPTNIVGEVFEFATGSVTGSVKLANAYRKGIENLSPEEADLIFRHLKKGAIGAAALLYGYFNPQEFGGFYQHGQKRKKDDVQYGDARIGGVEVSKNYIHNPLVEASQVGATVRRVADSKLRKADKNTQGMTVGAVAGALGLADETPFIREMTEIGRVMNPQERERWASAYAKSLVVPQMVQSAAKFWDKDKNGEVIQRDETTVKNAIKSGIPGLRQEVPLKKSK